MRLTLRIISSAAMVGIVAACSTTQEEVSEPIRTSAESYDTANNVFTAQNGARYLEFENALLDGKELAGIAQELDEFIEMGTLNPYERSNLLNLSARIDASLGRFGSAARKVEESADIELSLGQPRRDRLLKIAEGLRQFERLSKQDTGASPSLYEVSQLIRPLSTVSIE